MSTRRKTSSRPFCGALRVNVMSSIRLKCVVSDFLAGQSEKRKQNETRASEISVHEMKKARSDAWWRWSHHFLTRVAVPNGAKREWENRNCSPYLTHQTSWSWSEGAPLTSATPDFHAVITRVTLECFSFLLVLCSSCWWRSKMERYLFNYSLVKYRIKFKSLVVFLMLLMTFYY